MTVPWSAQPIRRRDQEGRQKGRVEPFADDAAVGAIGTSQTAAYGEPQPFTAPKAGGAPARHQAPLLRFLILLTAQSAEGG